jgi:hypothetical protein
MQQDADILGNACTDVFMSLQSGTLRCVLEVTLRSGNYLNMGTSKGGAGGFQLEDLTKLATVKGKSKACPTLLHFVAAQVLQQVRCYPGSPWLCWSHHVVRKPPQHGHEQRRSWRLPAR